MKRTLVLLSFLCCSLTMWATVAANPYTVSFTCTGSQGPFPFTFSISDPTSLTVTLNGSVVPSPGYTITPVNNNYNNGGNVTLGAGYPCTSGFPLVLNRITAITQTSKFYDNMPTPNVTFGNGLDKATEIMQEIWGRTVHSIQLQVAGANYLSPVSGGLIILNFTNCTVAGTQTGSTPAQVTNVAIGCPTGGGGGSLVLQTNGSNNTVQSLLNLIAGSNITLTADGSGGVTIASTGGGTPGGTSGQVQYNNSGVFGGISTTGSGNVVLATSATLVTPALGTPASGNLANTTGYPQATSSTYGIVKPDNSTITISGGVISSTGGGGSPGGSNLQMQYNNSSAFGGAAGIVTDSTKNDLFISALLYVGNPSSAYTETTSTGVITYTAPATIGPAFQVGAPTPTSPCTGALTGWNVFASGLVHWCGGGVDLANRVYATGIEGTATAITGTLTGGVTAYDTGVTYCFLPAHTYSTGSVTVNFDSIGTVALLGHNGASLVANELVSGDPFCATYNGTNLQDDTVPASSGGGLPSGTGVVRVNSGTGSAVEISGDATTSGSNALTLNTVNVNVGSFTNANITVNGKGLITAAANGSASGTPYFVSLSVTGTISGTAFSQPKPSCGRILIPFGAGGNIDLTLPASMPAAGTCITVTSQDGGNTQMDAVIANSGQTIDNYTPITNGVGLMAGWSVTLVSDGTSNYTSTMALGSWPAMGNSFAGPGIAIGSQITNHLNSNDVIIGWVSGGTTMTGGGHTIVGFQAGSSLTSGQYMTCFGVNTCYYWTTQNHSTAIGYLAGSGAGATSGTCLGDRACASGNSNGTSLIVIGDGQAGNTEAPSGVNNYLNIGYGILGNMATGHYMLGANSGTGPTIASNACGSVSQGTVGTNSNDAIGYVTVGSTTVTSCVLTFSVAWTTTAPVCFIQAETGSAVGLYPTESTTALTIHATSGIDSTKINYHCLKPSIVTDGNNVAPTP